GPLHGRQGGRRVRRVRDRRQRVRTLYRTHRTLRRRDGSRLDDGRRLLSVRREGAPAERGEHGQDLSPQRPGPRAGDQGRHGTAAGGPGTLGDPRSRARVRGASRAPPHSRPAAARSAPQERERRSEEEGTSREAGEGEGKKSLITDRPISGSLPWPRREWIP